MLNSQLIRSLAGPTPLPILAIQCHPRAIQCWESTDHPGLRRYYEMQLGPFLAQLKAERLAFASCWLIFVCA
jgi:hypothetical protein